MYRYFFSSTILFLLSSLLPHTVFAYAPVDMVDAVKCAPEIDSQKMEWFVCTNNNSGKSEEHKYSLYKVIKPNILRYWGTSNVSEILDYPKKHTTSYGWERAYQIDCVEGAVKTLSLVFKGEWLFNSTEQNTRRQQEVGVPIYFQPDSIEQKMCIGYKNSLKQQNNKLPNKKN